MLSPLLQVELEDVQSKLHALKPLVGLKDSPVHQQVKQMEKTLKEEEAVLKTKLFPTPPVKPLKNTTIQNATTPPTDHIWNAFADKKTKRPSLQRIPLNIVPRKDWSKRIIDTKKLTPVTKPYNHIVIHHSGEINRRTPYEVESLHMDERKFDDIGYNYLIDSKGKIYEGRNLKYQGAHVNSNSDSDGKIGVLMIGDFHKSPWTKLDVDGTQSLTLDQLESMRNLVKHLECEYPIDFIGGHDEYKLGGSTECPGSELLPHVRKIGF